MNHKLNSHSWPLHQRCWRWVFGGFCRGSCQQGVFWNDGSVEFDSLYNGSSTQGALFEGNGALITAANMATRQENYSRLEKNNYKTLFKIENHFPFNWKGTCINTTYICRIIHIDMLRKINSSTFSQNTCISWLLFCLFFLTHQKHENNPAYRISNTVSHNMGLNFIHVQVLHLYMLDWKEKIQSVKKSIGECF